MNSRNKGQAAVSSALLLAGILGISMFTSGTTEQSSTPENDIEIHDLYEMEQAETGDDFAVAEEIEKSEIEELNTSESLLVSGDSFSSTTAPSNGAQDEIVPDPETSETNAAQHDDETASITADAVSSSITEAAAAVQVYYFVNENVPFADGFSPPYDASYNYSPLDELGRCGRAWAILSQEAMPTQPRGSIGMIRPSGWHLIRYDFIDGQYLYNRCHLIGYQLGGSNSPRNLITGTRF